MEDYDEDKTWEFVSRDPYSKMGAELRLGSTQVEFVLPRKKKGRPYTVVFTAKWDEIISFDCGKIVYCEDEKTWPSDEALPDDYKEIGPAGILFLFLRARGEAFFQVWAIIPVEDIPRVTELVENYLGRASVLGLAHHGTTGAVRYMLDRCKTIERVPLKWHDWIKTGPSTKPRKKFNEVNPELVICREGLAFDFFGASPKLQQMSTFWPWRLIRDITILEDEVPQIAYIWHEDSYTFEQQVWDDNERRSILAKVRSGLEAYKSDDSVPQMRLIRPWSFPSVFHETWADLEPFASKASREGFPPVLEEEDQDR